MNHSIPGLPVHHHLPEFTQTHVHRVSDAIQPSHPLLSPSPPAPKSLPESESFPMSQLFAWCGQSTGVSALAETGVSFFPKNTQGWSPLEWTGWISLQLVLGFTTIGLTIWLLCIHTSVNGWVLGGTPRWPAFLCPFKSLSFNMSSTYSMYVVLRKRGFQHFFSLNSVRSRFCIKMHCRSQNTLKEQKLGHLPLSGQVYMQWADFLGTDCSGLLRHAFTPTAACLPRTPCSATPQLVWTSWPILY